MRIHLQTVVGEEGSLSCVRRCLPESNPGGTYNAMSDGRLALVYRLELLKPVPRSRQAKLRRQPRQAEVGLNVSPLFTRGEGVPTPSLC
jgi:hypothetical protein